MGYLGRTVSATPQGDSGLVVKEVEWTARPMSAAERQAVAALDVGRIRKHWPDPRLRRVTIVFERPRRLGPIVIGGSDAALVFNIPRRESEVR